jgi:putative component of membrane protein insertase Oxa1/YidC/SpoIIIJ protein YidD
MPRYFVFLTLCHCWLAPLTAEGPWGKDASLARSYQKKHDLKPSALAVQAGTLISFHREVISPADGPRSHFLPSSSQYTFQAMYTYGFGYGFLAGCDRLMRENSEEWIYPRTRNEEGQIIKSDPVR